MKRIRSLLIVCLYPLCAVAQTAGGPVLGWTPSASGQVLRAIYGVPGASRLGSERKIPAGFAALSLNPAVKMAAGRDADSGAATLFDLETFDRTALDGATGAPDLLVWSPMGTALALYDRSRQWAQLFVSDSGTFHLKSEMPAAADRIAVADSGQALLALHGDALSLYTPAGAAILAQSEVSGFTFLAGSDSPAYWSGGSITVGAVSVPFAKESAESVLLASPLAGTLLAIRSGGGIIVVLNGSGETAGEANCACSISGIEGLGRGGILRLVTDASGPLWAISAAEPRTFFIPDPPQADSLAGDHKIR
jgi:hypothetical protein